MPKNMLAKYPFGPKYPFPPDSPAADLHWFQGWGERLQSLLDDGTYNPHNTDWAIFRPDDLARKAMMRFGATYPMVIKPVSDALDITEACFQSFCDGGCALYTEAAGDFSGAEHVLLARIQTAADIIGKTPPADSPADNGKIKLPENPEVYKLALKIKRELPKGGTKEDIALDFTNGDEKKAASLLRQLRPDRFGHLLD